VRGTHVFVSHRSAACAPRTISIELAPIRPRFARDRAIFVRGTHKTVRDDTKWCAARTG
jgi:hypothetical protein